MAEQKISVDKLVGNDHRLMTQVSVAVSQLQDGLERQDQELTVLRKEMAEMKAKEKENNEASKEEKEPD